MERHEPGVHISLQMKLSTLQIKLSTLQIKLSTLQKKLSTLQIKLSTRNNGSSEAAPVAARAAKAAEDATP